MALRWKDASTQITQVRKTVKLLCKRIPPGITSPTGLALATWLTLQRSRASRIQAGRMGSRKSIPTTRWTRSVRQLLARKDTRNLLERRLNSLMFTQLVIAKETLLLQILGCPTLRTRLNTTCRTKATLLRKAYLLRDFTLLSRCHLLSTWLILKSRETWMRLTGKIMSSSLCRAAKNTPLGMLAEWVRSTQKVL